MDKRDIRLSATRLKSHLMQYPWFEQMATGLAQGEEAIIVFSGDRQASLRNVPSRWEGYLVVTMGPFSGTSLSGKVARRWLDNMDDQYLEYRILDTSFDLAKTAAISAGAIRTVDEGVEVMHSVIRLLIQAYSKEIAKGMNTSFKHYMPEDVGEDFRQFLQDRGDKVIRIRPMINRFLTRDLNRKAPLLAKGMNLMGDATVFTATKSIQLLGWVSGKAVEGGKWAVPKIKEGTIFVAKKGGEGAVAIAQAAKEGAYALGEASLDVGEKAWQTSKEVGSKAWQSAKNYPYGLEEAPQKTARDESLKLKDLDFTINIWAGLLMQAQRQKASPLATLLAHYKVEDVADEINLEFNQYLKDDLAPRRFLEMTESVIAENKERIVWWIINAVSRAIMINARQIENNFNRRKMGGVWKDLGDNWEEFKAQPVETIKKLIVTPLIKAIKNKVNPQVANMTKKSLLIAIQQGITDTEDNLAKEIGKALAAPNHAIIIQALSKVYQSYKGELSAVIESELLPRIRGQIHPAVYENVKLF